MQAATANGAAERQRRWRRRRRDRLLLVKLEVDRSVIAALIDRGHLDPVDAVTPERIGEALMECVDQTLGA